MRRAIPILSVALVTIFFVTSCTWGQADEISTSPQTPISTSNGPESTTDTRSTGDLEETDNAEEADKLAACEQTTPSDLAKPGTSIQFYATCVGAGDAPYPIYRDRGRLGVSDALRYMTAGLTDIEREAGIFSWFDTNEEIVASSTMDQAGIVSVRFDQGGEPWRPAASTSSQVISLIDPIAATFFAFPAVQGIERSGLCFGDVDCSGILSRSEFEQTQFLNNGVIASRSCGSGGYWDLPELCNVDEIRSRGPLQAAAVVGVADDDTLNMRAGPSADAFIIADSLRQGAVLQATEILREADDGGLWRLVFDEADRAGWVNSAFLDSAFLNSEQNELELTADRFVAFAKERSPESFARLPFTERVQLGLGPQLLETVDRVELQEPAVWVMDLEYFRAYVGPFSIIEPLQRVARWQVEIGQHNHCAGAPMPVPAGLESATIVSIQPAEATIDSCLQWFAVDLFIDSDGRIQAVTFDTWEP